MAVEALIETQQQEGAIALKHADVELDQTHMDKRLEDILSLEKSSAQLVLELKTHSAQLRQDRKRCKKDLRTRRREPRA